MILADKLYLILTFFMVINAIYRLVYNKYDWGLKLQLYKVKSLSIDENARNVMSRSINHEGHKQFYGSVFMVFFVFIIEMTWFVMGLFTFLWPFYLIWMGFNYVVNILEQKREPNIILSLFFKIIYLIIYCCFGICYYFHFT